MGDFRTKVRVPARDKTAAHDVAKFIVRLPVANDPKRSRTAAQQERRWCARRRTRAGRSGRICYRSSVLLLIGFWIFLFRQMQAGGAKAFSFGKSKAKLLSGDTPKVTFADVAGADEAKVELQEIIEFLKDPQKFTQAGRASAEGRAARRPAGHGQDAARARRGR